MKTRSLKRFHFSFKTFALLFLCVTLLAGLLPENVSAASSIGLSAYAPRPGNGTITISWNKVSNASFYAYSVRDTTTNASICDRTQTSKAYAKVSHTWEAGHSYRVWAGACCEGNDPDNTSTWDYTGMTTFTVEACAHSHTETGWDINYTITCTPISDTQHTMKGYEYEYCTNCFEHIGSSYKVTETVGHDFDENGDCPSCGYTHACAHTRTKLVEIDGYPAYIQDSETKHIVDIQYKRVCRDCDAVVDKLVDSERVYQREDHDFNSKGVCRDCGYVKPAQQEPLKISVSASPSSAETGVTLSASATASGGDGNYSFSWKVTCDGSVVVNTDLSYGSYYSYAASKAGSYVFTATVRDGNGNQVSASSGTLTVKAPACQHPSTEIAWDTSRTITYKSVSDQEHTMTGYQYKYCTVCFERVGDSFSASETVSHDFDSNGDCPSCGYTHACPHTRTNLVALDGYPAYRPDSETQHIVDIQYKEVCSDCNAVVNKLVDSARVYKREDHNFNENGTCRSCGYVKPAQQEPLKISVSASPSSAETGASLSASAAASGGDGNYSFSWKVTCDGNVVANTDLSYGSTYNHTASKAGSYVFTATVRDGNGNQVSASSGAITVKAPVHVHNYKENIIKRSNYVNQNENEHDVTVTYTMKCDGCGDETARKTKTVRAAHAYTSKGHIEGKHQDGKGHATFDRCACGAAKYTGYAKYGNCCTCYGHAWGSAYLQGEQWLQKCTRCGKTQTTTAPTVDPATCSHVWDEGQYQEASHAYLYTCVKCGATKTVQKTSSEDGVIDQSYTFRDKKQEAMDDSIDFIERSANGKDGVYEQFFTDELRKEITKLADGQAANVYDFIDGDVASLMHTSQADYYVDTLMKQCAGINSDSKTISIEPTDFEMICNIMGLEDATVRKLVEKWLVDRWTNKYGVMILDKDEFEKEMKKYDFKAAEWFGTSLEIGSYLWDCLYDYNVYSTALDGNALHVIDSAWSSMDNSDLEAAKLASTYIKSCETVEGRIAYILLKNANIADFARDEAFDVMLKNPSLKLAYEASTFFNDAMFGTTDLLEANHGTYWSMQIVEELHDKLNDCIDRYHNNPNDANYNDCLGTYSLYTTYLISTYNGVLESIEVYSNSIAANIIGDELTDDEKAMVEQWKLFMKWYADDIEYALKDNSIDAIMKQIQEMR